MNIFRRLIWLEGLQKKYTGCRKKCVHLEKSYTFERIKVSFMIFNFTYIKGGSSYETNLKTFPC